MKVSAACAMMALCLCSCSGTSSTKQVAMNWDFMDYQMSEASYGAVTTATSYNLIGSTAE